jgi:hypothetical protein
MLNSLLDKLGTLLSKSYMVSAGFPVLIFVFVNAAFLYAHDSRFRELIRAEQPATVAALTSQVLMFIVLLVIATYILSTLQPLLRELLEGRRWHNSIADPFREIQKTKYDAITNRLVEAKERATTFDQTAQWRQDLGKATQLGDATGQSKFTTFAKAAEIEKVRHNRLRGELVDFNLLQTIKTELEVQLSANSASLGGESNPLDKLNREFGSLLQYAIDRAAMEVTRLYTLRAASFGDDDDFLPTAAGNISRTMVTYAYSRYHFNLDLLWTRLLKVMQSDTAFYPVIQDVKAQLDFAVSTFWLLLASAIVWFGVFAISGSSVTLFLLAAIGLPLAAAVAYAFAVVSYRSFTDVVRSSVDLYRLDLLKTLHLPLPRSADAERAQWEDVSRALAYGELIDQRYEHSK